MKSYVLTLTFLLISLVTIVPQSTAQAQETEDDHIMLDQPFDAISVDGGWDVSLFLGKSPRIVSHDTGKSLLALLDYKIEDRVLYITSKDSRQTQLSNQTKLNVYYNDLNITDIEATNGSSITSPHEFTYSRLYLSAHQDSFINIYSDSQKCTVQAIGNSEVVIHGKCRSLRGEALMHSYIDANTLRTKEAYVNSSGSSDIFLGETERLIEDPYSEGHVRYTGNPRLDKGAFQRPQNNRFGRNKRNKLIKQPRRGWQKGSKQREETQNPERKSEHMHQRGIR